MRSFEQATQDALAMSRALPALRAAQETAEASFAESGHVYPFAVVLARRNPMTGQVADIDALVPVPPVMADFGSGPNKDAFAEMLRTVAAATRAVGVVFISEAWFRDVEVPAGKSVAEVRREAIEQAQGGLKGQPGVVEGVVVTVQVRTKHGFSRAVIDRAGPKPTLGKWSEVSWTDLAEVQGTFADMLPPPAPSGEA